jgi:hypothetical protein
MEKFAGVEQMLGYQRLRGPNVAPAHGLEQAPDTVAACLGWCHRLIEMRKARINTP